MKEEIIIKVEKLTKIFKLPHEKYSTVKQHFVNVFSSKGYEKFKALDNVSFEIKKGEFFGIIGANGSGKSTLLKILAQIYQPTSGKVEIKGTLSPFIELGVGFNPDLTARDNVFLNAAILGLSKKQTEEKFDEIIDFAELREFLDQKLKNFSSGMQVRLAFSIAIQAHSDILLIDEVLAVGDSVFQQKCLEVFRRLKGEGKTIIFVSHGLDVVRQFSDRVLLIDKGKILAIGNANSVINDYVSLSGEKQAEEIQKGEKKNNSGERWGDGKIQITSTEIISQGNSKVAVGGDKFDIVVSCTVYDSVDQPIFGIVIRDQHDRDIFVTNTKIRNLETESVKKGQKLEVSFSLENTFEAGEYTISPAVADNKAKNFHDWRNNFRKFIVFRQEKTGGLIYQPIIIEVKNKE